MPLPTFADIADAVIADVAQQSGNEKVRYRAGLLLGRKYCGVLQKRPVNAISASDLADILKAVRAEKPETARKLYGLLRKVFEAARVLLRDNHGIGLGDMPTNLADLKAKGFDAAVKNRPLPALDWHDAPDFMTALRGKNGSASRALELAALIGLRESEAANARWDEFNFADRIWTVPIERMKDKKHLKRPHRVPLSSRAIELLEDQREIDAVWVFPGLKPGKPIAPQSMLEALKKLNRDAKGKPIWVDPDSRQAVVVHGFRLTLRTWAEEHGFRREAAEESLAHSVGSKVEARYRRTDILEERRRLMDAWASYCVDGRAIYANVIPIGSRVA